VAVIPSFTTASNQRADVRNCHPAQPRQVFPKPGLPLETGSGSGAQASLMAVGREGFLLASSHGWHIPYCHIGTDPQTHSEYHSDPRVRKTAAQVKNMRLISNGRDFVRNRDIVGNSTPISWTVRPPGWSCPLGLPHHPNHGCILPAGVCDPNLSPNHLVRISPLHPRETPVHRDLSRLPKSQLDNRS